MTDVKYKLATFKEQDKLEEYLLKTEKGDYVKISSDYGTTIGGEMMFFAGALSQDKLKEGLIKLIARDNYLLIDNLKEIEYSETCFIATVVYGGNAPQISTLQNFRDNVLIPTLFGKAFVDFYNGGAGKRTANFIKNNLSSTIPTIRKGLDSLVEKYISKRI